VRIAYNFGKPGQRDMWYLSELKSNILKPHIYNDSHPAGGHWYRVKADHTLKSADLQLQTRWVQYRKDHVSTIQYSMHSMVLYVHCTDGAFD
jgi:hypothetical protein